MNPQPDQQLDLLDFIPYTDGGRQGAPPPPPEVTQCRWCHHSEPNGLLLRNNHTPDSYRAINGSVGRRDGDRVHGGVLPGSERELGEVDGKVGAFVPEVRACDGTNIDRLVGCCSLVVWLAFGVAAAIGACGGPGAPVGSRRRRAPHGHGPA